MKTEYKTGDIVTHEFHNGLLEVVHSSKEKAVVTYDFATSEYEVDVNNLTLVCEVENRNDI